MCGRYNTAQKPNHWPVYVKVYSYYTWYEGPAFSIVSEEKIINVESLIKLTD